jgi:transposase-like protein
LRINSGQITKAQAARENDISPSLLSRWIRQISEGTMRNHPSAREKQLEKELEQYKKKVGELTMMNDLLKKIPEQLAQLRKSDGLIYTGRNTAVSKQGVKR